VPRCSTDDKIPHERNEVPVPAKKRSRILAINPKVDHAFKHMFGRDSTRPLLINAIDSVLQPRPGRPAIDFAAVRAAITMAAVLQLLGFQANRIRGAQQRGPCPLHGSTSGTSRCFSANLDQNQFHCFKCGRSGNALDLWAQATSQTPYDAAIDLCERLHITLPALPNKTRHREEEHVDDPNNNCTMPVP
jgi:hypothetical protein